MRDKTELLAPAGDIDSFYAACNSGADAVYMGLDRFNARTMANNFSVQEYIYCIKYAHKLGIKIYLTLNTIIFGDEVKNVLNLILELYEAGLDAIILQDIGLAKIIHELFPDLAMHASTQMSVYSLEQINFLKSIGFTRVVLARELTLKEIEYICKNTDVEIEVFVHGALCISMSGQCLLSHTIGGRSANRGACAQPCRLKYTLIDDTENKIVAENRYILSKKDIFGIDKLEELKNAGVYSFKIEGRNRTYQYVNLAVSKYRKALDGIIIDDLDKKELSQMFIRESKSLGYLNGVEYKTSITNISPKNTGLMLGTVEDQKGPYVKIRINENISLHDGFEIYNKDNLNVEYSSIITCIKDNYNKIVNNDKIIPIGEYAWIGDVNKKIPFGSIVYKTSSIELNKKYSVKKTKKPKVDVNINILKDKKIEAISKVASNIVKTQFPYIPESAIKSQTLKDSVISNFRKTADEEIEFNHIEVLIDNDLYIPVSILNELRRTHVQSVAKQLNFIYNLNRSFDKLKLEEKISHIGENINSIKNIKEEKKNSLFIYKFEIKNSYNFDNIDRVYISIQDFIRYESKILSSFVDKKIKVFVSIPNYTGKNVSKYINKNLEELIKYGLSGVLLGSFEHLNLCLKLKEKYNIKLIADYSFNITNIYSVNLFKNMGFDMITPSIELNEEQILELEKIIPLEIVNDYVTVMTSRYCIIGAFYENRNTYMDKCKKSCVKSDFSMFDSHNQKYDIITDPYDCIMRIVKPIINNTNENISTRKTIIKIK